MKSAFYILPFITVLASCTGTEITADQISRIDLAHRVAGEHAFTPPVDRSAATADSVVPRYVKIGTDPITGLDITIPVPGDSAASPLEQYIEAVDLDMQADELAAATGGVAHYLAEAGEVTDKFVEILDGNLQDNTDLIFMIDCTSSMGDDIDNVKMGCATILTHVRMKQNVRVGVVQYRDRADGPCWFQYIPLSTNYDFVGSFIRSIKVSGGGADIPESMYDAACLAMDTMEWRQNSSKMMLVLGDAPSLVPPRSVHGAQDVVEKSAEHGVQMNFYPVIISPVRAATFTSGPSVAREPLIGNIYPVPTAGDLTIEMNEEGDYVWDVMDVTNRMVLRDEGYTDRIQLSLVDLPNGTYIVRVRERDGLNFESKQIVVAH